MDDLNFDISKFLVGQLTANELGTDSKYNVQFVEYYMPSNYDDEINEIKQSDIDYYELEDGSIHFHIITYSKFEEE